MSAKKAISISIQNVIIVVSASLAGSYFTSIFHVHSSIVGGLWAVISGIIVIESTFKGTAKLAKVRIIGSLIGAIISGVYLIFFSFSVLGYAVCIAIGVLVAHLFRQPYTIKLTGITISVVLMVSTLSHDIHPVTNAALRFAESVIGTVIALAVAYAAFYFNKQEEKC